MKRAVVVGLLMTTASAVAIGVTVPASASPGGGCPSSKFCIYENNNYNAGNTDHWRDFTADNANFNNVVWLDHQQFETDDHMDNEASSIKNRTGKDIRLYQNTGFTGTWSAWHAGVNDPMLGQFADAIGDNRASAVDFPPFH